MDDRRLGVLLVGCVLGLVGACQRDRAAVLGLQVEGPTNFETTDLVVGLRVGATSKILHFGERDGSSFALPKHVYVTFGEGSLGAVAIDASAVDRTGRTARACTSDTLRDGGVREVSVRLEYGAPACADGEAGAGGAGSGGGGAGAGGRGGAGHGGAGVSGGGGAGSGGGGAGASGAGDVWRPMTTLGAPSRRAGLRAFWTGREMLVWGGTADDITFLSTGALYDPVMDSWRPTSMAGAPTPRRRAGVVWTGSEMMVWGGSAGVQELGDGASYDPASDRWTPLPDTGAPAARHSATVTWAGSELFVWGGCTHIDGLLMACDVAVADGARYRPGAGWSPVSQLGNPPPMQIGAPGYWTGSEVIVWGGGVGFPAAMCGVPGGRYRPADDRWASMSTMGAPAVPCGDSVAWTDTELVDWDGSAVAHYDPLGDLWRAGENAGQPAYRFEQATVWTGAEMILWGGVASSDTGTPPLQSGGRYAPGARTWRAMTTMGAPAARHRHAGVWTGSEVILWGGNDGSSALGDGARYVP